MLKVRKLGINRKSASALVNCFIPHRKAGTNEKKQHMSAAAAAGSWHRFPGIPCGDNQPRTRFSNSEFRKSMTSIVKPSFVYTTRLCLSPEKASSRMSSDDGWYPGKFMGLRRRATQQQIPTELTSGPETTASVVKKYAWVTQEKDLYRESMESKEVDATAGVGEGRVGRLVREERALGSVCETPNTSSRPLSTAPSSGDDLAREDPPPPSAQPLDADAWYPGKTLRRMKRSIKKAFKPSPTPTNEASNATTVPPLAHHAPVPAARPQPVASPREQPPPPPVALDESGDSHQWYPGRFLMGGPAPRPFLALRRRLVSKRDLAQPPPSTTVRHRRPVYIIIPCFTSTVRVFLMGARRAPRRCAFLFSGAEPCTPFSVLSQVRLNRLQL